MGTFCQELEERLLAPMTKMSDLEKASGDGGDQSGTEKEYQTDFNPDEGVDGVVDVREIGKK